MSDIPTINERLCNAKPLFLIAPPRSGTTILTRILNSHPEILLTNETAVFINIDNTIQNSKRGAVKGILYGKSYHELWSSHLEENSKQVIESYYEKIAAAESKTNLKYWGEKHPHLHQSLDFLKAIYPEAHYVYMIREPRDTVCSIAKMNRISRKKAASTWQYFSLAYEKWIPSLPAGHLHVIRYDDLVDDYMLHTKRLLKSLGLTMSADVIEFIENNKHINSHLSYKSKAKQENYKNSLGRWRHQFSRREKKVITKQLSWYLDKYGYSETGDGKLFTADGPPPGTILDKNAPIRFRCNICGDENVAQISNLSREEASCDKCGSTVRMRSVVHILLKEVLGASLPLLEVQPTTKIKGIGLSDWNGYASVLRHKFDYINTFYHTEPRLDITQANTEMDGTLDFIISSDVFEHIEQPVSRAFENCHKLLKQNGVFIFTVPYMVEQDETIEHFPALHDYKIEDRAGRKVLINHKASGEIEEFENLVFHGGDGLTLEMRLFAKNAIRDELLKAGFSDVTFCDENAVKYGIYWPVAYSLPILAKK